MTDPNLPQNTPAPAYQPFGQQPAGQQPYGQQPYGQQVGPAKYNVLAIVSLVSAFFISLVAIITGHIALSQIKKTGEQGRGLAIAGLILGYVGIISGLVFGIILIAIIASNPEAFNTLNT